MKFISKVLVVLFSTFLISCTSSNTINVVKKEAKPAKNSIKVILMAGQSNMAGAGNFNELSPVLKAQLQRDKSRVLLSNNGGIPEYLSANFSFYQLQKRGFGHVFGPELLSGLTLAEKYPDSEFLLIKTSMGGTSLYGAWNPDWSAEKSALVEKGEKKRNLRLFRQHINNVKNNLKDLKSRGQPYEIVGMFWMQGENDAAKQVSAENYETNLKTFINSVRTAVNLPELPFVVGQINSNYGKFTLGPALVRKAMENVVQHDKHAALIETSTDKRWLDYPKHTDDVHYNTEGQIRLGVAFADKLTKLSRAPH